MSTPFSLALLGPHEVITRAEVTDSAGLVTQLAITAGSVDVDATAGTRRRCNNVTIADITLAPRSNADLLAAFQNEIKLYRGVRLASGLALYSLGVFGIDTVVTSESKQGLSVTLTGLDRSQAVRENAWQEPYSIAPGTDVAAAIRALILNRLPSATFNFTPTTGLTTPGLLYGMTADNDPWKDAMDLATAAGMDLYPDPDGVFTLRPIVDPSTAALSWSFGDSRDAVLLGIDKESARSSTYTRVVAYATGTGIATPLRSVATVPGASRIRTFTYSTAAVLTQARLDAVAAALLLRVSGDYSTVRLDAVPDPRLDVGTVGLVTRGTLGVDARYVLDKFTIGLGFDTTMPLTLRGVAA